VLKNIIYYGQNQEEPQMCGQPFLEGKRKKGIKEFMMKNFKDKIAVVTGAASGIGRGLAERCLQEGMKVVLADVEDEALAKAERDLRASGAPVLAVRTDVSRASDVSALAQKTLEEFGAVHMLFNNAGVGTGSTVWECSLEDWQWVISVNLWGVIHGVRMFVPIMLEQDTECHIVNTASVAGLVPYHPSSPYHVTKHAVVALSENLYYSLAERKAKVNVSVLCPGYVNTQIMDSGRNRPPELQNVSTIDQTSKEFQKVIQEMHRAIQSGMSPHLVADYVFNGIREEKFYILTHPEYMPVVKKRMEKIMGTVNPDKYSA
jgi:NAD(P)-dependent dehydrogenase (short-subunit alcohol dehydrogenase family)